MSLDAAISEIKTRLESISGLSEIHDKRIAKLADYGISNINGLFLVSVGTPIPWPEVSMTPTSWSCAIRIEIGAVKLQTEQGLIVQLSSWVRSAIVALRYNSLAKSTLWEFATPIEETPLANPDVRISVINMKIRYTEQ